MDQSNGVVLIKEHMRRVSTLGSEYDECGTRLLRDRGLLPCRMRKIWGTLALFQFLTGAALLITDIYAHNPISHVNPLLSSENTKLIYFRFDLYLGILSAVAQLIAAFLGLLPLGIPCRVYPPAKYRTGHFLFSVFAACLMVISAVSYGIILSNISQDAKLAKTIQQESALQREQRTRDVVFTFKILLSLLIILSIGAVVNFLAVVAVCTANRKCHRNCKVCSAEN
ncbi:hypothetical protein BV898_11491 [Hypsibius exemplaris]|uniref:Uncharacterized protein n=1 Tax=Hypsibius exemplaris TaxID=2072580 RepID=A0A1W0WGB9_HYPEX|nr:hypothetical protein BV898_11491 [Hypsibius exemplaris]